MALLHIRVHFSTLDFPVHGFKLFDKRVQIELLRLGRAIETLFAT
jgi:hypothetical protein